MQGQPQRFGVFKGEANTGHEWKTLQIKDLLLPVKFEAVHFFYLL